jgi:hypothetical protein
MRTIERRQRRFCPYEHPQRQPGRHLTSEWSPLPVSCTRQLQLLRIAILARTHHLTHLHVRQGHRPDSSVCRRTSITPNEYDSFVFDSYPPPKTPQPLPKPWPEFWNARDPWPAPFIKVIRLELDLGAATLLNALNDQKVTDVRVLRIGTPSSARQPPNQDQGFSAALCAFVTRNRDLRVLDLQCCTVLSAAVQCALVESCPSLLLVDWHGAAQLEYKLSDSAKDIKNGVVHRTRSDLSPSLDTRLRENLTAFNLEQDDSATFMGVDIPTLL